jgi:hypothetical protein
MDACRAFQDHLAAALGGPPHAPVESLRALSWHRHLLQCASCRDLLAAEEALEGLLATLPAPRLPAGVAARVLARLAEEREAAELDRLLDLASAARAPEGLARNVLARLEEERQATALDRLLELDAAPVPSGLAKRVLAALESERAPLTLSARWRRTPVALRLAAAGVLALGGAAALDALLAREPQDDSALDLAEAAAGDPPPELLESLELLQDWELINGESLDVVLTGLDTADEVLLEIDRGRDPLDVEAEEPPTNPGKG